MHSLQNTIIVLKKTVQHFQNKKKNLILIDERRDKLLKISEKINYDNLMFHYEGKNICQKVLMILIMNLAFLKSQRIVRLTQNINSLKKFSNITNSGCTSKSG